MLLNKRKCMVFNEKKCINIYLKITKYTRNIFGILLKYYKIYFFKYTWNLVLINTWIMDIIFVSVKSLKNTRKTCIVINSWLFKQMIQYFTIFQLQRQTYYTIKNTKSNLYRQDSVATYVRKLFMRPIIEKNKSINNKIVYQ